MARLNADAVLFTLYIVINNKKYREFIKERMPKLYNRIYKSKEEYTKEDIISFFLSIDATTLNTIMLMQDILAYEGEKGQIGTSGQWYRISLTCVTAQGGYINSARNTPGDQGDANQHEESVCTGALSRGHM